MSATKVTVDIDASLWQEFEAAARSDHRDAGEALGEILRDFVRSHSDTQAYDAWFRARVAEGIAAAEAGDVVSHEEVEAEARAWREDLERRLAESGS